jgi:hypothetical protein
VTAPDVDPALDYAQRTRDWYRNASRRARLQYYASETGILAASAGTVLVAALRVDAVVTAVLAAVTLFLTGARTIFTPNDNWVRTSWALRELDEAILRYLYVPESERAGEVRDAFLEKVLTIGRAETTEWRGMRLKSGADKPAGPEA